MGTWLTRHSVAWHSATWSHHGTVSILFISFVYSIRIRKWAKYFQKLNEQEIKAFYFVLFLILRITECQIHYFFQFKQLCRYFISFKTNGTGEQEEMICNVKEIQNW